MIFFFKCSCAMFYNPKTLKKEPLTSSRLKVKLF